MLDTKPLKKKTKSRFIFDSRWSKVQECENMIKKIWNRLVTGSRMFKVPEKLKWCKIELIKWRKEQNKNARKEVEQIKKEICRK